MRDRLAHHYFATDLDFIRSTVEEDLDPLEAAVARMRERVKLGDDTEA